MIYHANGRLMGALPQFQNPFTEYLRGGYFGVELFFAISGYILSLQILKRKEFSYRDYIKRRILRIEPPFLVSVLIIFFMWYFFGSQDRTELVKSLFSVLTYTSNIFGNNIINVVTWSLEIEIQFYLLLPFFLWLLRKSSMAFSILAAGLIALGTSGFLDDRIHFSTLLNYFQWFAVGIMTAILQVKEKRFNTYFSGSNLLICFLLFYLAQGEATPLWAKMVQWVLMLVLFNNVLILRKGIAFLSIPLVSIIGGMCYTVYLYHYPVMNIYQSRVFPLFRTFLDSDVALYSLGLISLTVFQLVIAFVMFKVFEKPFMYKDWPTRFRKALSGQTDAAS